MFVAGFFYIMRGRQCTKYISKDKPTQNTPPTKGEGKLSMLFSLWTCFLNLKHRKVNGET